MSNSKFTVDPYPPDILSPNRYGRCSKCESFEDIGAFKVTAFKVKRESSKRRTALHLRVGQNSGFSDSINNLREHVKTSDCFVDLSSCVIAHHNTVILVFNISQPVLNILDSSQKGMVVNC